MKQVSLARVILKAGKYKSAAGNGAGISGGNFSTAPEFNR
jgi:hypothetical protein